MRMTRRDPIAVVCSDLHLSLIKPVCRADKDWMEVQARYLKQLKEVAGELPIICAGDIFDRWNPSPELINFALRELPDGMLCVPGQHDLPFHQIDQMARSGYGVLAFTGKIQDLTKGPVSLKGAVVWGFGWEEEIKPPIKNNALKIAAIHRYCWMTGSSYPGAPDTGHVNAYKKKIQGYDVAVFGDNHAGFVKQISALTTVINCGGFIRRKSDEIDYRPMIGVVYSDGSVSRHRLDTAGDLFHEIPEDRKEVPFDMKNFIDGLEGLGEHGLDFKEAVTRHLNSEEVDSEVRQIIMKALENV
jgi:hypothetical protein